MPWGALFGLYLPQTIRLRHIHWYTQCCLLQKSKMVLSQHRSCLQVCGLRASALCVPVVPLTDHPHVRLQACSMAVLRATVWRHVCRVTVLLEISQPGSAGRKMRLSVSVLFSWLMSAAAGPTCRCDLLSRSPEARGNWVWCYTGRNNQEQ